MQADLHTPTQDSWNPSMYREYMCPASFLPTQGTRCLAIDSCTLLSPPWRQQYFQHTLSPSWGSPHPHFQGPAQVQTSKDAPTLCQPAQGILLPPFLDPHGEAMWGTQHLTPSFPTLTFNPARHISWVLCWPHSPLPLSSCAHPGR